MVPYAYFLYIHKAYTSELYKFMNDNKPDGLARVHILDTSAKMKNNLVNMRIIMRTKEIVIRFHMNS